MSVGLFRKLAKFIEEETGIRMPPAKNIMLSGRLSKRVRVLGLESLEDCVDYLFGEEGKVKEMSHFIDAVTTNKTEFFRERYQMDYLGGQGLYELTRTFGDELRLWSAPVSEGHEAYSLAMKLEQWCETCMPGLRYSILGVDLSEGALKRATSGIYPINEVTPMSEEFRKKYLLKKDTEKGGIVRVVPKLRDKVSFRRLNLMDEYYAVPLSFRSAHVIFCRNVLIYFDKERKEQVVRKLLTHLLPGGLFFSGASESLTGMDLPLESVDSSIYRRLED